MLHNFAFQTFERYNIFTLICNDGCPKKCLRSLSNLETNKHSQVDRFFFVDSCYISQQK